MRSAAALQECAVCPAIVLGPGQSRQPHLLADDRRPVVRQVDDLAPPLRNRSPRAQSQTQ
jgi:hypothetical protein